MASTEFDPVEFINKTYAEATHYELNDTLSTLSKSIARTQQESRTLIAEHFTKFIECRMIMEEIWADIQKKGLDKPLTDRIEQQHLILAKKHSGILEMVRDDEQAALLEDKKAYYMNEYAPIFTLKEDLAKNMHIFENFVAIFQRAYRITADVMESKFIRKCFEDVQPLVREFLEKLYKVISSNDISFEDACYHFELYFSIQGGKTEQKIRNTLLVNFKDKVCSKMGDEHAEYLLSSLSRLLRHVDGETALSALDFFYDSISRLFDFSDISSSKIILRKIQDFGHLSVFGHSERMRSADTKREFIERLATLKLFVFKNLVERNGIANASKVFEKLQDLFDEREANEARNIIVQEIIATVEQNKYTDYDYLAFEFKEVQQVSNVLGHANSPWNRKLFMFLKKQKKAAILKIASRFEGIIKDGCTPKTLMEASRIIVKAPAFYGSILFETRNSIVANPIVFYYLAHILKMERPSVSTEDSREVERLKVQFGFLLEKISIS